MQEGYHHTSIAKNSLILYLRMIVTTIISLYTSRVILKLLGLSDFGIFSVVAGIIEFAAIFTGSMTSATQRFLSYDLGRNDLDDFNKSFCSLYNIYIIFCLALLIISLPIGIWIVNNILEIPGDRLYAATWVFISAVMSFELTTIATPYLSALIAYERMEGYTLFSISDAILKLVATLVLFLYDGDRLIAFALTLVALKALLNGALIIYCKSHIAGCNYHLFWDWERTKKMASFSGWTLIGSTSYALMTQGHSILLNVFFGPIINAAKGIADRVKNFSLIFTQNIFLAITPQVTKSYAAGDIPYLKEIAYASSRLSFMLLLLVTYPLMMEMRPLLELWLGTENVTNETVSFSIYSIIFVLISTIEAPLTKVVQASGNVKSYEIIVGIATLSFIPISYILLRIGYSADSSYIVMNTLYFIIIAYRLHRVKELVNINYEAYFIQVATPILLICILLLGISHFASNQITTFVPLFFRLIIWFFIAVVGIWTIGVSRKERAYCKHRINDFYHRKS